MGNKINEKVENGDDIFIKDKDFLGTKILCQYKLRSKILNVLKQNFNVEEDMIVISEKKENELE